MKRLGIIHVVLFASVLGLGWGSSALAQPKGKVEIPVTKVSLFSSGVGYFEHFGAVEGEAVAQLMFKADQINDVLKSMVLMDLDKGQVTSVNYASRDPLLKALKSFAIDLSGDPKLADLLKQLRGAEVEMTAPEPVKGKIVSVEEAQEQVLESGAGVIVTKQVLNLLTEAGIKSYSFKAIQSIRLTDENLAAEMNKALELLIASHDTQRKPVDIHFTGVGKRRVRIGYISETPVWKTSYRLDLSGEKPLIQGWAIVENTSDNDWSGVELTLVSGRPISFVQDLYTPLYLPRPIVHPELYASLQPQEYDEGIAADEKAELAAENGLKAMPSARRAVDRLAQAPAPPSAVAGRAKAGYGGGAAAGDVSLAEGVQSIASAGKVGELFNFTIKSKVDLPRRQSAMLPIINTAIKAEKVSIYNASVLAKHPLNGVRLTNDTDMKLLEGPITVFDEGMYAGDARIDNMGTGENRLISYAIDLNVTVDPSMKSAAQVTSGKIVNGVLQIQRMYTYEQTYDIHNKAWQKRDLIIEQPFCADRKLLEPKEPMEKTPALYRFRMTVDPNAVQKFLVKEQQPQQETIMLLGQATESLLFYSKNGEIAPKVRDAIAKAAELKQQLSELEGQLDVFTAQRQTFEQDQKRQRDNIQSIGKDAGQRYITKLSQIEDQIEAIDKQIAETKVKIEAKKKELAEYLNKLNVE